MYCKHDIILKSHFYTLSKHCPIKQTNWSYRSGISHFKLDRFLCIINFNSSKYCVCKILIIFWSSVAFNHVMYWVRNIILVSHNSLMHTVYCFQQWKTFNPIIFMGFHQQGLTEEQWMPVSTNISVIQRKIEVNRSWTKHWINWIWLQYLHGVLTFKNYGIIMNQEKKKTSKWKISVILNLHISLCAHGFKPYLTHR